MHTHSTKALHLQKWVVGVGALLMAGKYVAYVITNSNAILTDALESIVNVSAGLLALYSLWLSARPKDLNHPYGHGKIEFISAGVEGALIVLAGGAMFVKAIYNLIYPVEIQQLSIGIIITAIAGAINYLFGFLTERYGKQINSIVLEAEGRHLKSDAYSTIGMLIGLGVVFFTNELWLDNIIAMVFGGVIAYTGVNILKRSISGIMDEVDTELVEEVLDVVNANRRENWIDLHNLRIIKYGSQLHVDAHLTLPWYLNIEEGHEEVTLFDELINKHGDRNIEFFIHMDPCVPSCCTLCSKQNCPERKDEFKQKVKWTLKNVLLNKKHEI